jgi:hypothetical protein
MQAEQTIGIDLPLKVLAWEDASGNVWVTYNDPAWLAARHGLGDDAAEAVSRRRADAIRLLCAAARLMAIPSNRVRTTDKAVKRLQSLTPRTICLAFANKRRRSGDAKMADCIRPTPAGSAASLAKIGLAIAARYAMREPGSYAARFNRSIS